MSKHLYTSLALATILAAEASKRGFDPFLTKRKSNRPEFSYEEIELLKGLSKKEKKKMVKKLKEKYASEGE